eukprot:SAG31_NODE_391_length_16344_cov_15.753339_6_plen_289_part_00
MTEFINVAQLNESVSDSVTAQQSLSRSVLAATWCRCQGYVETLRRHSRIGSIPVSNTCSNPPASSVYSGQPQPLPTLPSFRTNSSNATASNGTLETNLIFGNGTARTNLTSGNGTARTNYNDTDNTYANESISAVPQVIQTCVRVTTGVVNNSEGTLEIFVDGVEVTSSESTVYAEGSIVVDECFVHNASEILSIGARNPTNNEWVGVFELYRNSSVIVRQCTVVPACRSWQPRPCVPFRRAVVTLVGLRPRRQFSLPTVASALSRCLSPALSLSDLRMLRRGHLKTL